MYTDPQKKFRPRSIGELEQELQLASKADWPVRRIFLADGDAMTLSVRRLREILQLIRRYFPEVQRISSYCLPRNIEKKTIQELSELRELGLSLMYVGCETGDDEILRLVQKGETFESSLSALRKIKQAGMKSSVMILNGMGGKLLSEQHAVNSARLMNMAQPEYLATLVLTFPKGLERYQDGFDEKYMALDQIGLFREMQLMLETLELDKTIFRSDHASNYLVLKGVLGRDKQRLLSRVKQAIETPNSVSLREEWQRGL